MKLFVSVPTGDDCRHDIAITDWLIEARDLFRARGWKLYHKFLPDKGITTPTARNALMHDFRKTPCDAHLTIDSDCRPDIEGLLHLVDAIQKPEVDVVAGWMTMLRSDLGGLVPSVFEPPKGDRWPVDYRTPHAPPGLYEITGGGVATHCVMMTREVADRFWEENLVWFEDLYYLDRDTAPSGRWGTRRSGHDLTFSARLADLGLRLWLDNRVFWGHAKVADLADWYRTTLELSRRLDAQLPIARDLADLDGIDVPPEYLMRAAVELSRVMADAGLYFYGDAEATFRRLSAARHDRHVAVKGVGLALVDVTEDAGGFNLRRHPAGTTLVLLGADRTPESRAFLEKWVDGHEVLGVEVLECQDGRAFSVVVTR